MVSNKKSGNRFEQKLCTMLSGAGFWAHNLANRANGQPFDVIAAKNNVPYAFDCKVCSDDTLKLSRIEENQIYSMAKWQTTMNKYCYFALELSDGYVRIIHANMIIRRLQAGAKSLSEEEIMRMSVDFETFWRCMS